MNKFIRELEDGQVLMCPEYVVTFSLVSDNDDLDPPLLSATMSLSNVVPSLKKTCETLIDDELTELKNCVFILHGFSEVSLVYDEQSRAVIGSYVSCPFKAVNLLFDSWLDSDFYYDVLSAIAREVENGEVF